MKTRHGFVSNSSSSSFVVPTNKLFKTEKDVLLSLDGVPIMHEYGGSDVWEIHEEGSNIVGTTSMDNGALKQYFEENGLTVLSGYIKGNY